jgi:hypothetical protein
LFATEEDESEEETPVKRTRNSKGGKQEAEESDSEDVSPRRGRSSVKPTPKAELNGTAKSRRGKSPVKDVSTEYKIIDIKFCELIYFKKEVKKRKEFTLPFNK